MIKNLLLTISLLLLSCNKNTLLCQSSYSVSDYEQITSSSHCSEGGFARINKNKILLIYRKDPSLSHVSNNSKIVFKTSRDNGNTWGEETILYDSVYDDRNLIVGNLDNGDIIIVLRRYNANKNKTIDTGYIISRDKGKTWKPFTKIQNTEGISNQPFGEIIIQNKTAYFLICFDNGITKKYSSSDSFHTKPSESVIINDNTKMLQEPFLISLKNDKKIILFRNGKGKKGQKSFFQYNSKGDSFFYKGETNIFSDIDFSIRSPLSMRYDSKHNLLEVCANSRILQNTKENNTNELRIYSQNADSVYNNPKAYKLKYKRIRPLPSNHWFYGYPKSLRLSKNEILYLITDSRINDPNKVPHTHLNNEQANLYTFKVKPNIK